MKMINTVSHSLLLLICCGEVQSLENFIYDTPSDQNIQNHSNSDECVLQIDNRSVDYFRSRLEIDHPNVIYFFITFNGTQPAYTKETFYPFKWIWTYATTSTSGVYPYLHWNIDYDIYSFNLLDSKTLRTMPYINILKSESCNLTLGTTNTTELIAEQLTQLVSRLGDNSI